MALRFGSGYFKQTPEYKLVGRSPLVRFRPHWPMTEESRRVALPLARAAVRGKLGEGLLGSEWRRCIVLEGLNLSRRAQLDLLLLNRSGGVALVECKRTRRSKTVKPVRLAAKQLFKYESMLRRLTARRLRRRIAASYDRFGFPEFEDALRRLGVRARAEDTRWWRRVERTLHEGSMCFFVAAGREGRTADVWAIEHLTEVRL